MDYAPDYHLEVKKKEKSLVLKGTSINKIRNYLFSKGINEKFIKQSIDKIKDENDDQDFFSAIKL